MLNWSLFTLYLVLGWIFYCKSSRKIVTDHKGQKDAKEVARFLRVFQAPIVFFWLGFLAYAIWVKYRPYYFEWKQKRKKK